MAARFGVRTQWLTHPLHPGVLENLSSAEAHSGVPDQQLGYEIFGALCDVSPVLLWELILALLDALEEVTLCVEIHPQSHLDSVWSN